MFGRKQPAPREEDPGHQAVLRTLTHKESEDPTIRLRLAGQILFDFIYRMTANEKGARIEDVLGILGACGGFSCIVGVMHFLQETGCSPAEVGMLTAEGADGNRYYFGDLPNRDLLESELALLSLALGAAHGLGAPVTLAQVQDVMKHVAASVGGPEFGVPRLPREHTPGDLPIEYVRHLWPKVREALDLYEVPVTRRATAIGFAVQHAIDQGKSVLDPLLASRIVTEYAVPAAKLDPARFQ